MRLEWKRYLGTAGPAALLLFAGAATGFASSLPVAPSHSAAPIVAHLRLDTQKVDGILIRHPGERTYLYLTGGAGGAVTVVDVTDARTPSITSRAALAKQEMTGPAKPDALVAIAGTARMTGPLQLFDLSDPANPRVVRSFENVTAYLPEPARGLLYVVNDTGLWIVQSAPHQTDPGVRAWEQFTAAP